MDIQIRVHKAKLSDNSEVFNVHINGVVLHACSEHDAYWLRNKIRMAINDHSVEMAHMLSDVND